MFNNGDLTFFFNDTATTEIYTLSLHDALPISSAAGRAAGSRSHHKRCDRFDRERRAQARRTRARDLRRVVMQPSRPRSEEHTSELQSTPISRMPSSA